MDLKNAKKIYIIGIEGAGTSALARILASQGKEVSGSDDGDHFYADMLESQGIKLYRKFSTNNIPSEIDIIIYSSAFNEKNNVELAKAKAGKIPALSYAQALGELSKQKYGIAVCGTHGKTTTTAWLSYVLVSAGLSPSAIVGSKVKQFNGSTLVGSSNCFIFEADEYQNKLQYFNPQAVLLNNIDYDHPDFFSSKESYTNTFIEFIKKIPKKGWLVANIDDPYVKKIVNVNCRGKVITYAIDEAADYVAYDINMENHKQFFKVKLGVGEMEDDNKSEDGLLGDFCTTLLGRHNVYNALAVIAASIEMGVDLAQIRQHLEGFMGTARRMEIMGSYRGAVIIDDYAHHPTEIKATLETVRGSHAGKNIVVVFHPHTFTRTKALLKEFGQSFTDADEVIVIDIYGSAREEHGGVHSLDLVKEIKNNSLASKTQDVSYLPDFKQCEKYLRNSIGRDDVLILMGAGDVFRIGENLIK